MTRHAQSERHALCDELERLGPEADTINEGWRAKDLAAHLLIRETRPDLVAGLFIPALEGRTDKAMTQIAAGDFSALVQKVRSGPPVWNPMAIPAVDEKANLAELFVHFEDLRRAQPDWTPRNLSTELQQALWATLKSTSKLMLRKAPTGVVLIANGLGRHAAKAPGSGGTVVVRGPVGELLLFAFGRERVAKVTFEGNDDDVAALRAADFGV
ncbi:MAG: TIGR03085 family metal-binding protein [Terracoccus sp.]